jgi:Calx-beta domain-containing protein
VGQRLYRAGESDRRYRHAIVTFTAGTVSRTITIKVLGDSVDEADETFFVNLVTPQNATIVDGQGIITIVDNDP